MDELKNKIKAILQKEGEFTGKIEVIVDEDMYTLELTFFQEFVPLSISYNGTEEGFIKYLSKDLPSRRLSFVKYYTGYKTVEDDESGINY